MKKIIIFIALIFAITFGSNIFFSILQQPPKGLKGKIVFEGSVETPKGKKPAIGIYDLEKNKTDMIYTQTWVYEPMISPDEEKIVFQLSGDFSIYSLDVNNLEKKIFLDSDGGKYTFSTPSWSFEGDEIVFAKGIKDEKSGEYIDDGIYILNLKKNSVQRILDGKLAPRGAEFSPDGKKIAFIGHDPMELEKRIINPRLYVMDIDKKNVVNIGYLDQVITYNWSPDSNQFCYISNIDNQIHIVNADGSNDKIITNLKSYGRSCSWSPDGTKIIFDYMPPPFATTPDEIYVINVDGTGLKRFYPKGKWTSISSPQWWAPKK